MDKDFVRDQNPTPLYHVDKIHGMPDYIKEAQLLTNEDVEALHSTAFADRGKRLHPIHTKVASLLSGVYLAGNGETEGQVWDSVKEACDFYGVGEDLEKLITAFVPAKEAGTSEDDARQWAVSIKWDESQTGYYYPINDIAEIKEAAVNLDQDFNRDKLPLEVFRMGAINIVKAAAEKGVPETDLPHTVKKAGERRLPNLDYADLMLYTRAEAGVSEEGVDIYRACVKIAKEAGTDEAVEQAVSLWRDLDEKHGLSYRKQANGRQLPTPYDCFYTGITLDELEKTACSHVVLCNVMIPREDFETAVLSDEHALIKREFSKKAAEDIIQIVQRLNYDEDVKMAAVNTSNDLSELPEWQQKRLLSIVADFHKKAGMVAAPTPNRGRSGMGRMNVGAPVVTTQIGAPIVNRGASGTRNGTVGRPKPTPNIQVGPSPPNRGASGTRNGVMIPAPAPAPTPAPTQAPAPEVDWNSEFQKYHGTAYDPNSKMDAGKLEQMQAIMKQHGKLSPSLVYG